MFQFFIYKISLDLDLGLLKKIVYNRLFKLFKLK